MPFIFFGVCYFLLRVKPGMDLRNHERDLRSSMLRAGSVDVICNPWPDHGADFERKVGTIKGEELRQLSNSIHLQFDSHPELYHIPSAGYYIQRSLFLNMSLTYGYTAHKSLIGSAEYYLTPESCMAIKNILTDTLLKPSKNSEVSR